MLRCKHNKDHVQQMRCLQDAVAMQARRSKLPGEHAGISAFDAAAAHGSAPEQRRQPAPTSNSSINNQAMNHKRADTEASYGQAHEGESGHGRQAGSSATTGARKQAAHDGGPEHDQLKCNDAKAHRQ